eukprot:TRINITY_DN17261_c0_g1_i1.p1 TRINITY_DN17261_c0_g1~~TRINITY_DN17261_c0_g1_i1.p1  ORF type:complete len:738 (+),score=183.50 TRINITY_DN17261_c0_g1_i1:103-2316(+)
MRRSKRPRSQRSQTSVKRRFYLLIVYLGLNVVYIVFGGIIMYFLEHPNEEEVQKNMEEFVAKVNLSQSQRDRLEELGVCTFPDHRSPHWTVTGSSFFTFTVITTIGYGAFAPETTMGRAFTTLYAVPGIAIVGLLLGNTASLCSEVVSTLLRRFAQTHQANQNQEFEPKVVASNGELQFADFAEREDSDFVDQNGFGEMIQFLTGQDSVDQQLLDHVWQCVDLRMAGRISRDDTYKAIAVWFEVSQEVPGAEKASWRNAFLAWLAVVFWTIVWGALFSGIEGWTLGEGMWFAFVSLTTIGFGDFAPDTISGRIAGFFFIAPGLGLMGAFFTALANRFLYFRFWRLHGLHQSGKVTDKLLEAQGIQHTARTQKESQTLQKETQVRLMSLQYSQDPQVSARHQEPYEEELAQSVPLAASYRPVRSTAGRGMGSQRSRGGGTSSQNAQRGLENGAAHGCLATCARGHRLVRQAVGKGPRDSGHEAHMCDVCDANGLRDSVYRCGQCDFDVCEDCATSVTPFTDSLGNVHQKKCPKMHTLAHWTQRSPYGHRSGQSPRCDICGRANLQREPSGYGHCGQCSFDVCAQCLEQMEHSGVSTRRRALQVSTAEEGVVEGSKIPMAYGGPRHRSGSGASTTSSAVDHLIDPHAHSIQPLRPRLLNSPGLEQSAVYRPRGSSRSLISSPGATPQQSRPPYRRSPAYRSPLSHPGEGAYEATALFGEGDVGQVTPVGHPQGPRFVQP